MDPNVRRCATATCDRWAIYVVKAPVGAICSKCQLKIEGK